MSDFYSRKAVTTWRIVFYGILAAAGVAAVGYFEGDHRLYYFAAFAGVMIGGFGFLLSWTRSHVKPVSAGPGPRPRATQMSVSLSTSSDFESLAAQMSEMK